jgi:hypothetical protein
MDAKKKQAGSSGRLPSPDQIPSAVAVARLAIAALHYSQSASSNSIFIQYFPRELFTEQASQRKQWPWPRVEFRLNNLSLRMKFRGSYASTPLLLFDLPLPRWSHSFSTDEPRLWRGEGYASRILTGTGRGILHSLYFSVLGHEVLGSFSSIFCPKYSLEDLNLN